MRKQHISLAMLTVFAALGGASVPAQTASSLIAQAGVANPRAARSNQKAWSFDSVQSGGPPEGWKIEGTRQRGPLATWKIQADSTAPSHPNVLALTSPNHDSNGTFNLCWTDQAQFKNGQIKLNFKARSGKVDQGGGPIWRAKDKNNYYVCRANPLENNFRLYYVKDGYREEIASANVVIGTGTWHAIEIVHEGRHIECHLDGKKLIDATDSTFSDAGGIGLWTKADAATAFDDLEVISE